MREGSGSGYRESRRLPLSRIIRENVPSVSFSTLLKVLARETRPLAVRHVSSTLPARTSEPREDTAGCRTFTLSFNLHPPARNPLPERRQCMCATNYIPCAMGAVTQRHVSLSFCQVHAVAERVVRTRFDSFKPACTLTSASLAPPTSLVKMHAHRLHATSQQVRRG